MNISRLKQMLQKVDTIPMTSIWIKVFQNPVFHIRECTSRTEAFTIINASIRYLNDLSIFHFAFENDKCIKRE